MSSGGARHATGSAALVVLLLLTVAALSGEASTIVYTDRAAFSAAAGPTTLLTFDPVLCGPLPDLPSFYCRADYGLLTVLYDSVLPAGSQAPPHIAYGGTYQVNPRLTQPVRAIGFDITPSRPEIQFTVFLSSVDSQGPFTFSAPSFLGFVSTDSAFSEFFLNNYYCTDPFLGSSQPCAFTIDNMALAVPEPGTFAFLVPGLVLLWSTVLAGGRIKFKNSN